MTTKQRREQFERILLETSQHALDGAQKDIAFVNIGRKTPIAPKIGAALLEYSQGGAVRAVRFLESRGLIRFE